MGDSSESIFTFAPAEVALGRVIVTPNEPQPYKVVFRLGERTLSEHPVTTVREGEALIRRELASIQFAARHERPDPDTPKHLASVS